MSVLNLLDETDKSNEKNYKCHCACAKLVACACAKCELSCDSNKEAVKCPIEAVTAEHCCAEHLDETAKDKCKYCYYDRCNKLILSDYCNSGNRSNECGDSEVCYVTECCCKCDRIEDLAKKSCYQSKNCTNDKLCIRNGCEICCYVGINYYITCSEACCCADEELEEVEKLLAVVSNDDRKNCNYYGNDELCVRDLCYIGLKCFYIGFEGVYDVHFY